MPIFASADNLDADPAPRPFPDAYAGHSTAVVAVAAAELACTLRSALDGANRDGELIVALPGATALLFKIAQAPWPAEGRASIAVAAAAQIAADASDLAAAAAAGRRSRRALQLDAAALLAEFAPETSR